MPAVERTAAGVVFLYMKLSVEKAGEETTAPVNDMPEEVLHFRRCFSEKKHHTPHLTDAECDVLKGTFTKQMKKSIHPLDGCPFPSTVVTL